MRERLGGRQERRANAHTGSAKIERSKGKACRRANGSRCARIDPRRIVGALGISLIEQIVDRKSTRLNSSHANISYAVFCLNKTYFFIYAAVCILYLF